MARQVPFGESLQELLKMKEQNRLGIDEAKRQLEKLRDLDSLRHHLLTEEKKIQIRRMLDTPTLPTASIKQNPRHLNPYTFNPLPVTPEGHEPEKWVSNNLKPETEQPKEVVPTGGKKHHIEVEDVSHKIAPTRKTILGSLSEMLNKKTRSTGPK